jgi:hypothetical protein
VSWSVLLMNLPAVANSDEIPKDFEFVPLGTREEVIARIRQVAPDADFTPHERVDVESDDYHIELFLGEEDPVKGIVVSVTAGDGVAMVRHLLDHLAWPAMDIDSGQIYAPETDEARAGAWRRWCEQIFLPAAVERCASARLEAS